MARLQPLSGWNRHFVECHGRKFPSRVKTLVIQESFSFMASLSFSFLVDGVDVGILREMRCHGESLRDCVVDYLPVSRV